MSAGKFESKHGVGLLLNKKWRKGINWTEYIYIYMYINERAIATSITIKRQRVLLNPRLRKVKENRHARKLNQKERKNSAGQSPRKSLKKQHMKMKQQPQETKSTKR